MARRRVAVVRFAPSAAGAGVEAIWFNDGGGRSRWGARRPVSSRVALRPAEFVGATALPSYGRAPQLRA
eukprot:11203153-Lingulodinium_polyedra.AAC.1